MLAKAFVVAMGAEIARSDYAKPTLIHSRSREWLIACRWGPEGEYLSIATAGTMQKPSERVAPDAIAPIHSLFGVLASECEQNVASTFFAGTPTARADRTRGHVLPGGGVCAAAAARDAQPDLQNPVFA